MTFNKRRRTVNRHAVMLAALLLGTATSCFDDSYDLSKDIDMTVNVGGEHLAFPVGSTEKITLDKIIEIEEGDDLQTDANGAYHLLKSGEIDDVTTDVKPVFLRATDTEVDAIEVANEWDFELGSLTAKTQKEQSKPIETSAEDIDEAVKEIHWLTTERTPLSVVLVKEGNMEPSKLEATVSITFPTQLQVEGADEENRISFPITETDFDREGRFTYETYLTGIVFGDGTVGNGEIIGADHRIDISEDVTVNVQAAITVNSINPGDQLILTPTVHIDAMEVKEISGLIDPNLDESTSSMELTNLPEFLENEETRLDITNPVFTFHANNPLDTPVKITGTLSGRKNGQPMEGSEVQIGGEDTEPIILNPGDNTIALSRLGNGGPEGAVNIRVEDINNLITRIPDVVDVTIQPIVNSEEYFSVELDRTYTVECKYDIDVPLSFGSNLKIVYEETIEDISGEDMKDMDFKETVLTALVDNTIPLGMELQNEDVEVLDQYGQKIEGIEVTVTGSIKAGNGTEQVVSSPLDINLKTTQKGTLSQMDAIRLKITAASGESANVQLYDTQWMQLKDIKLKIPKGVTVDMN